MYILIRLLMNQGYLSAISLSTEYSTIFKIRLQQFATVSSVKEQYLGSIYFILFTFFH